MLRVQSSVVSLQGKYLYSSYRFVTWFVYSYLFFSTCVQHIPRLNIKYCMHHCSQSLFAVNHFSLSNHIVLFNLNPKFCIGRCSHFLHLVNHFALTIAFPIIFIHLVAMDDLYQEQCELWQKLEACFKTLSSKSKAEQTRGFAEAQQIRLERCFLLVKENNKTTKKS